MKSESEKREWKVRAKSGSEKWEWKVRVRPVERHLDSFPQLPGRHLHVGVAAHPGESCNAHMCANANED